MLKTILTSLAAIFGAGSYFAPPPYSTILQFGATALGAFAAGHHVADLRQAAADAAKKLADQLGGQSGS